MMISIIIPYFNRPDKIIRAVKSVLKQSIQDFEIIIVDDCSPTPLVLDIDPRIQVIRNKENRGPGISRNHGMELAKGDYIAFLDSDDYWHPKFLSACLQLFGKCSSCVMVYSKCIAVKEGSSKPKRDPNLETTSILPFILQNYRPWSTSSCLWKSDIVLKVAWIDSRNWEDYAFDCAVAIHCNHVAAVDEFLVYYDLEGEDKLSKRESKESLFWKSKSLFRISSLLNLSHFKESKEVKKEILRLLLSNNIALISSSMSKDIFGKGVEEITKWKKNPLWAAFLNMSNLLPTNLQLKLLRKLRTYI